MVWTGTEYVAGGDCGWILKSTDGLTWTQGILLIAHYSANNPIGKFYGVTRSGSRFVTVGQDFMGYTDNGLHRSMTKHSGFAVHSPARILTV